MQKVLFLDRDGTLIIEPPTDFQVDSLEKLEFYPKVIQYLFKIAQELDYRLVMVTNQDGLGTESFPTEDFWKPHNKMMKTFENEEIIFAEVLIDKTFEQEKADTRKPRTGLLKHYLNNPEYDLANSFVIGDRVSDMELAINLGTKGIWLNDKNNLQEELESKGKSSRSFSNQFPLTTTSWKDVYHLLKTKNKIVRKAKVSRKTKETDINISVNLDGNGQKNIHTGIGFFDHMLEQIAHHAQINLTIQVQGDLHIDEHHTIEDVGIALGQAFSEALGNKRGIERYGFYNLVMDESLAEVALDFSGRNWLVWNVDFKREKVGEMPCEMFSHFFKSFTDHARCNLYVSCKGENEHHKIEAIFKAFARSIQMAKKIVHDKVPSTKGVI